MPCDLPGILVLCFQESLEIGNLANKVGRHKRQGLSYKASLTRQRRAHHGEGVDLQVGAVFILKSQW